MSCYQGVFSVSHVDYIQSGHIRRERAQCCQDVPAAARWHRRKRHTVLDMSYPEDAHLRGVFGISGNRMLFSGSFAKARDDWIQFLCEAWSYHVGSMGRCCKGCSPWSTVEALGPAFATLWHYHSTWYCSSGLLGHGVAPYTCLHQVLLQTFAVAICRSSRQE